MFRLLHQTRNATSTKTLHHPLHVLSCPDELVVSAVLVRDLDSGVELKKVLRSLQVGIVVSGRGC